MTQEEKARAYDEAIKRAKEINNEHKAQPFNVMLKVFPELKESEERIRKAIIESLPKYGYLPQTSIKVEDAIAWLGKQGESSDQIHYWTEEEIEPIISDYLRGAEHYGGMIGRLRCLKPKSLEKQGEQKAFGYENANIQQKDFAPKVEPKFKVGDWIANDYCMGKVIALTDDAYLLDTGQGIPFSCEHNVHLWTIADAKDGDVLQFGLVTAIFKNFIGNGCCTCYCSVWNGEFEIPRQDSSYGCHNATPATKEQRDLLFSKMKEAGYEWDAEKLELIKVPKTKESEGALKKLLDEQDKFYKEAKIVLEDKDTALAFLRRTGIIDEYGELAEKYRSVQTPATTISAVNGANSTAITDGNTSVTSKEVEKQYCTGQYEPDVREFPIEWKEENVDELSEFELAMMHIGGSFFGEKAGLDPNSTDDVKEQAKFLLSLVPKQGWSEEDEKMYLSIMSVLLSTIGTDKNGFTVTREVDWLKSLKDRYTWKPSERMLEALKLAKCEFHPDCSETMEQLKYLYQELKQLYYDRT